MRKLRLSLAGTMTVALLVGSSSAVLAQMDEDADAAYVTIAAEPREAVTRV